ncbi:MAG TPA: hypothetical protein VMW34_08855 [Anaerolineales bacterium]|nr:hypothetical protein [Anaerolineales bacterium]
MKEGLEANRKICQVQQTELRHQLLSAVQFQDAFQLFFKQHAMLHSAKMAQTGHFSLEDELFEHLSEVKPGVFPAPVRIPSSGTSGILPASKMWP